MELSTGDQVIFCKLAKDFDTIGLFLNELDRYYIKTLNLRLVGLYSNH